MIVALFLGALAFNAAPADTQWVTVERRGILRDGMTADALKRDVVQGALADAVARVAGVVVSAASVSAQVDSGGRARDTFSRTLRVEGRGLVLAWSMVSERWSTTASVAGGAPEYVVKLHVLVAREAVARDAGFSATVSVTPERCRARDGPPQASDEVVVTVAATRGVHWTVVAVTGDSADVLVPSTVFGPIQTESGQQAEVPSAADRSTGLRFRCVLPAGIEARTDAIVAVATRLPLQPPADQGTRPGTSAARIPLTAFNRWLLAIPPDDRRTAEALIRVVRTP